MRLKAPSFWYEPHGKGPAPYTALACCYQTGHKIRQALTKPYKASIPVLCIGNITAGGSGKTPAALAVMKLVQEAALAEKPCFLTRGYGGANKGPLVAAPEKHTALAIGDEPLLLAKQAPAIVAADRKKGALRAEKENFDLIVMDDGLQNPGLRKDVKFIVIDGATGFGNGRTIPAGPLREPVDTGLAQADAFILIGADKHNVRASLPDGKPVFTATLDIAEDASLNEDAAYVAFCGIAHPGKFRDTLGKADLKIAAFHRFPDHYSFTAQDLENLAEEAKVRGARLITTAKDAVRLPAGFATDVLPVTLRWDDKDAAIAFLRKTITESRSA